MNTTMDYQQQAINFLNATKTEMEFKKIGHDFYFPDDKEERDIWRITLLQRTYPIKKYSFRFGQSIANKGKKPTEYDVLACLTKYDPETFENFCSNYGYDMDSRKAEKTYMAVQEEWTNLCRLFTHEQFEQLQEIQ